MKKAIFLCDVRGTLTDGDDIEFIYFVDNLLKIKEKDNVEQLYFGLISSDDLNFVEHFLTKLRPLLRKANIMTGPTFSNDMMILGGNVNHVENQKVDQIKRVLDWDLYDQIYYADDILMFHQMMNAMIYMYPDVKFQSFILDPNGDSITPFYSTKKGIVELNKILNKYITYNKSFKK